MLVYRKADGSERAAPHRSILGVLAAVLGFALLIASVPRGIAQDIKIHHTIKTEWPRQAARKEKLENEMFTFSPDGKTLAFKHRYAGLVLWDLEKGKPRMAAGAWRYIVWDLDTGKERVLARYDEGDKRALVWFADSMTFSPDSKTLVYSTLEGIRFLDVATCREKGLLVARRCSPKLLALMPDEKTLAWNSQDGMVFWDIRRDQLRLKIPNGEDLWYHRTHSITQDGKVAVTLSTDYSSIGVWKIETGERQASLKPEQGYYERAIISPDGKSIAAVVCWQGYVDLWDVGAKKSIALPIEDARHIRIESMMFSPDSRMLAILNDKNALSLWELATAKLRATLPGKTFPDMQFSPDGRFLATGANGSIQFWDLTSVKRKPPAVTETVRLWTVLEGNDAVAAYGAIRTLAAFPAQALPLLRKELRTQILTEAESKDIARLLLDLDNDAFAVREKASNALKQLGLRAESRLLRALEARPSAEVRRRLIALLKDVKSRHTAEPIQLLRAVEVLELIGSREASLLLEELAQGACHPTVMQDAKTSLARLKKRPVAK
jgi:hypothetical protein